MRISIVVIATHDGVIGKENAMPWHLPDELKHFKQVTMGKPIVMGRKTFDSIGKPLPGRTNIVITRQPNLTIPGCVVVASFDAAKIAAGTAPELAVIGGAEIYRQVLSHTDTIYLTRIHAKLAGDTYFPRLDPAEWLETPGETHAVDERHAYSFTYFTLERIR